MERGEAGWRPLPSRFEVKRVMEGTSCTTTDDDWVRVVVPFYEKAARMEAAGAAEAVKIPFLL
jgi:hypothetical protein